MQLSFNVQWQFWADDWINVGFFDNRDAAKCLPGHDGSNVAVPCI
jgi:Flp pilus assembly protein CpaB